MPNLNPSSEDGTPHNDNKGGTLTSSDDGSHINCKKSSRVDQRNQDPNPSFEDGNTAPFDDNKDGTLTSSDDGSCSDCKESSRVDRGNFKKKIVNFPSHN